MKTNRLPLHAQLLSLIVIVTLLLAPDAFAQNRDGGGRDDGNRGEVSHEVQTTIGHFAHMMSVLDGQKFRLANGRNAVLVCTDCGSWPGDVPDCADLRDKVEAAAKANADAQKILDMFQSLLETYYQWQFWSGVGNMAADMVAAATTILTAGTATGAVYAGAQVLIDLGASASTDAMAEAVFDQFGIDPSGESALQDAVSRFNEERKKTNDAYQKAFNEWRDCVGDAQVAQQKIDQWNDCWATRICEFK